jgi:membrane fusion protein (multidrug efflux system)
MKKILMFVGGLVLVVTSSCSTEKEEKEVTEKFLATSTLLMDTTVTKDYVCQIHSISHIELRAQERGYLQKIFIDEGKFVKKGQLLFQIMPNLYQAEVQKAKAEADYAKIEYQNTSKLAENNVVSRNEQLMAKAKYDQALAELALAKVRLQFTEIRAPFDGYIDKFHVRLGSLIDEGDLITNLSDNRNMWVYFNVPEAEYLNYKTSTSSKNPTIVKLLMANNEIFPSDGIVETIEADFNNETGNIAFRATFNNPDALLRHGETGNIRMQSKLKNALIIPQKATYEVLEKRFCYVIDKNNVVHNREITIEAEMPDLYIIKSGLKSNERILLEGIRKVSENDKIKFNYEKPESVFKKLNVYVE